MAGGEEAMLVRRRLKRGGRERRLEGQPDEAGYKFEDDFRDARKAKVSAVEA
jgi:hypothetical protein